MLSTRRDALITLIFCVLVGGYVIIACQAIPQAQDSQGFGQGPGFYPQVLAWCLIGLGALNAAAGFKVANKESRTEKKAEEKADAAPKTPSRYGLVAAVLVLCILDNILMQYLGFFTAGLVLILAMISLIRPPKSLKTFFMDLVYSVGMVLVVYLVFEAFIKIQLPRAAIFG